MTQTTTVATKQITTPAKISITLTINGRQTQLNVAPWTTLMYAWMWAIGESSITGWEWLPIAVGVVLDLWFIVIVARLLR